MTDKENKTMLSNNNLNLTSGRLLARNTILNLIGQGAPILIAIFAIPLLIKGLGTDKFGALTLVWVVIGYFSLFDFGLGRALTKLVAEKLGEGRDQEIPPLVWTTLFLMLFFALIGALILGILSGWLIRVVLKIPEALRHETLQSFYLLSISIPVVISTAGLRGVLEAQQRFGIVNVIRIFIGIFTYLGPILVLPFSRSLPLVVGVLVVGRICAWGAHLVGCFYVMPMLRHNFTIKRTVLKPLMHFGSWMTITNIISPLMVYLDRFLIGAMLSVAAVAYYTTPYEMVTKLWIIPGALIGVLLPAFSTSFAQDRNIMTKLFLRSVKFIFLVMFPITLIIVTFAHEGLKLWIGVEFAKNSTHVLQLLTIGVFINSIAQVSFVLMQGIGRPDLTAKLHMIELPFYLLTVWGLIRSNGIEGAAFAWTARIFVDIIFLFWMNQKFLSGVASIIKNMVITASLALLIITFASIIGGIILKGLFLLLFLIIFILASWHLFLAQEERMLFKCFFMKTNK